MAWIFLSIAGLLEIVWAIGIKYTEGFSRLWPSVWTLLAMVASFYLLSLAAKEIPIGTAYSVWVGIGATGAAILGMILFQEPVTVIRLLCLGFIIIGVAGLKFVGE